MDLRRPLFQIEQWSPFLAKKIWGLTSLLDAPFNLALGFKVEKVSDSNAEVLVPLNIVTRNESGHLHTSAILAAAEFTSKILWHRHLTPDLEEMTLTSIHCRFVKPSWTSVHGRAELLETERENILRKLRMGQPSEYEMPINFVDNKDQQIASLNCVWSFKPLRPIAIGKGR